MGQAGGPVVKDVEEVEVLNGFSTSVFSGMTGLWDPRLFRPIGKTGGGKTCLQ